MKSALSQDFGYIMASSRAVAEESKDQDAGGGATGPTVKEFLNSRGLDALLPWARGEEFSNIQDLLDCDFDLLKCVELTGH